MVVDVPIIPKFVWEMTRVTGVNNLWLCMSRKIGKWGEALGLTICGCGCPENPEICFGK